MSSQDEAARRIQTAWRQRKQQNLLSSEAPVTSDVRWTDVSVHARLKVARDAADDNDNSPQVRMRRAAFFASRLRKGDAMWRAGEEGEKDPKALKTLETQHYLELVDAKHRYGSNLKYYHARWMEDDTTDNFFRWLDRGGGKDLSLDECSRERLEKERIIYLSSEQRRNYLVKFDSEGRLRWIKDEKLVDTTSVFWKDDGQGGGVVLDPDIESPRPEPTRRLSFVEGAAASVQSETASKMDQPIAGNRITKPLKKNLTFQGWIAKALEQHSKKSEWIYAADKQWNLYVGIKVTGTFQHSSFLAGGAATSAGHISVKNGVIHTLSPLSGHYRTDISHFNRFIAILQEQGADMSKAQITKAKAALWGMQHLKKAKRKKANVIATSKEKAERAAAGASAETRWKSEVLLGRRHI